MPDPHPLEASRARMCVAFGRDLVVVMRFSPMSDTKCDAGYWSDRAGPPNYWKRRMFRAPVFLRADHAGLPQLWEAYRCAGSFPSFLDPSLLPLQGPVG